MPRKSQQGHPGYSDHAPLLLQAKASKAALSKPQYKALYKTGWLPALSPERRSYSQKAHRKATRSLHPASRADHGCPNPSEKSRMWPFPPYRSCWWSRSKCWIPISLPLRSWETTYCMRRSLQPSDRTNSHRPRILGFKRWQKLYVVEFRSIYRPSWQQFWSDRQEYHFRTIVAQYSDTDSFPSTHRFMMGQLCTQFGFLIQNLAPYDIRSGEPYQRTQNGFTLLSMCHSKLLTADLQYFFRYDFHISGWSPVSTLPPRSLRRKNHPLDSFSVPLLIE